MHVSLGDSRVRRTFGFLAAVDLVTVLCVYLVAGEGTNDGIGAFLASEIGQFVFEKSLFDILLCSVLRTSVCAVVFFTKLKKSAIAVPLCTAFCSAYLVVKAVTFKFDGWADRTLSEVLIIGSLVFSWADFYVWFVQLRGEVSWQQDTHTITSGDMIEPYRDAEDYRRVPMQKQGHRRKLLSLMPWRWARWKRRGQPPTVQVLAGEGPEARAPLAAEERAVLDGETISEGSFRTAPDGVWSDAYHLTSHHGVPPSLAASHSSGQPRGTLGATDDDNLEFRGSRTDSDGFSESDDPTVLPPSPYSVLAGRILQQVVTEIDMVAGWDDGSETEMIMVHKKKIKGAAMEAIKGSTVVQAPAHAAFRMVMDSKFRVAWDAICLESRVVETVNSHTDVTYRCLYGFWPTTGRDFVSLRAWIRAPDGTYAVAETSIPHDAVPEQKKYVRGQILLGGFVIRPLAKYRCEVVTYLHADPKGMIPASLANIALERQAMVVAQVRRFLDYIYQQKRAQSKFKRAPASHPSLTPPAGLRRHRGGRAHEDGASAAGGPKDHKKSLEEEDKRSLGSTPEQCSETVQASDEAHGTVEPEGLTGVVVMGESGTGVGT